MNTKIIIGIVAVVIVGGGVLLLTTDNPANQNNSDSACVEMCKKASEACPSLIRESDCNSKCSKLSDESKEHLLGASSCEEITSRPDLIADLLIPEINTPEPVKNVDAGDCEAACLNYTNKCLSLVPNAGQSLYNEGLMSCIGECGKWKNEKIGCMIGAISCEDMTNACGL